VQIASGKDFEYGTSDDVFAMVRCLDCGNIYLNPRPTAAELGVIYPPNYYAYNYDTAINPLALKAKDVLDGMKVKKWLKYSPNSKPVFLDVGCGDGRYLRMMHELGVPKDSLYGVEMDERQIAKLRDEGYQAYCGRIEDVFEQLPVGSFEMIVLLQVLEHVSDPSLVMEKLSRLLRVGGVLIVETPNTESLDVSLFKHGYWGGYHFPRHWNLFSEKTLRKLAVDQGLEVTAFNYLPAHSFWIYSLHHLVADRFKRPKLAKFFDPFQNLPLLSLATGFDIIRATLGFKTSNVQMVATKDKRD
jgi:2-polyprenyl-3-methyl-5-hydroxy-6-metoxy-1,4-benzoquinol methylase